MQVASDNFLNLTNFTINVMQISSIDWVSADDEGDAVLVHMSTSVGGSALMRLDSFRVRKFSADYWILVKAFKRLPIQAAEGNELAFYKQLMALNNVTEINELVSNDNDPFVATLLTTK